MSDAPTGATPAPSGPAPSPTARARRPAWRWQLGLRGLVLLVVVAALGLSITADRRRIADLTTRVDRMRAMLGELEVADPTQLAAMRTNERWMEGASWDVYLPPGHRYRLALATRKIEGEDRFPTPLKSGALAPGRHRLTLTRSRRGANRLLSVREGTALIFEAEESPAWGAEPGLGFGPRNGGVTTQRPVGQPLQLHRHRFARPAARPAGAWRVPDGPVDGILLWVERQPDPPAPG